MLASAGHECTGQVHAPSSHTDSTLWLQTMHITCGPKHSPLESSPPEVASAGAPASSSPEPASDTVIAVPPQAATRKRSGIDDRSIAHSVPRPFGVRRYIGEVGRVNVNGSAPFSMRPPSPVRRR